MFIFSMSQDLLSTVLVKLSIYSAVDTMIGMDMVEEIKSLTRTVDNKSWDIENMNIKRLRELRGYIPETELQDAFKIVEEVYHDTTH